MSIVLKEVILHERAIEVPVPAGVNDSRSLERFIHDALTAGLRLKDATEIQDGTQRDPGVVGIRLVFSK